MTWRDNIPFIGLMSPEDYKNILNGFGKVFFNILADLTIGLYATFILLNFWDWFIISIFNLPSMSFFQMYGIYIVFNFCSALVKIIYSNDNKSYVILTLLCLCIPDDKREEANSTVDKLRTEVRVHPLGLVVEELAICTFFLVAGWVVHTFLI